MSLNDDPVQRIEDDSLGRAPLAEAFAKRLLQLHTGAGVVVGVLGPWGSGKTSFVNLIEVELQRQQIPVIHFNPWMFSGADQLVDSFFSELSSQLRMKKGFGPLGKTLQDYGDAFAAFKWIPVAGTWIEGGAVAAGKIGKLLRHREGGVDERRKKVETALHELEKPIAVVIDDIDRLTTPEIREIFKLVRLTANFPNIIYIVAFDRVRVETALTEEGIPGRDYLEKILQATFDIPAIPRSVLDAHIGDALQASVAGVEDAHIDEDRLPDVFAEIIRPLVRNIRDVRRYGSGVALTTAILQGRVELVDVLGLEAIRVFVPDLFSRLPESVEALTVVEAPGWNNSVANSMKDQVQGLMNAAGDNAAVCRAMVERLFPAAHKYLGGAGYTLDSGHKWLRQRRVANALILRTYLEHFIGPELQATLNAERAVELLNDRDGLNDFLHSLPPERWEDAIGSLSQYEDEFTVDAAVPASIVLLNMLPELPARPRGMFSFGPVMTVTRAVLRLLEKLDGPDSTEGAVREILPELRGLYPRLQLLTIVGHVEGSGHQLVSQLAASELLESWATEIFAAPAAQLTNEPHLLEMLVEARKTGAPPSPLPPPTESLELFRKLLHSAKSVIVSQTLGSRAQRRETSLQWDALVKVYGSEQAIIDGIVMLKSNASGDDADLLELATKYAEGWRPRDTFRGETDA